MQDIGNNIAIIATYIGILKHNASVSMVKKYKWKGVYIKERHLSGLFIHNNYPFSLVFGVEYNPSLLEKMRIWFKNKIIKFNEDVPSGFIIEMAGKYYGITYGNGK